MGDRLLQPPDRERLEHGHATGRWLGEAFLELVADFQGEPAWHFVFGRSDADEQLIVLYHDPRPTSRVFRMSYADGEWLMWREDPTSTSGSSPA